MERVDHDLIRRYAERDFTLRKLYEEHQVLEEKLAKMQRRSYLTPKEEMHAKSLKRRKLNGVDQMMRILAQYRPIIFGEAA